MSKNKKKIKKKHNNFGIVLLCIFLSMTCLSSLPLFLNASSSSILRGTDNVSISGNVTSSTEVSTTHTNMSLEYSIHKFNKTEYMVSGIGTVTDGNIIPAAYYVDDNGNTYAVTYINQQAFAGDARVTRVEIPESIIEIAFAAFDSCENLTELIFHENCQTILSIGCFNNCSALEEVIVPANITVIGDSVFRECQNLKKAEVYGGVGVRMFYGCENLKEVYIGDNITILPEKAFSECKNLDTVRMGKNVERICAQVFYNTSLKELDFSQHSIVPVLDNAYAFKGIQKITVPAHLYEEWIAAPEWSRLAGRIVPAE